MTTKILSIHFIGLVLILFASCNKETEPDPQSVSITINQYGSQEDINMDTLYLSSNYRFFGKALILSPDLVKIRYLVFYDENEFSSTTYIPEPGGTGFLVDSIIFEINHALMAPVMNHITLRVEATTGSGSITTAHTTFKLQPINYPFQFRFYDFNSSDTLDAGTNTTIYPFYSPLTVYDQIASMKVYRKQGFGEETLVDSFTTADFFYYQTGYLREYNFQVPSLPAGSGILHRFELVSTLGRTHVIQHAIRIK